VCTYAYIYTHMYIDMNIYIHMYTQRISDISRIVANLKLEVAFLCRVTESIPLIIDVVMNLNEQV